jgi:hypothetical protein
MSWWGDAFGYNDDPVYSGGISVTHLIPKLPASPLNAAVLSAIRNNGSIVNNIVAARNASMFSNMERYLKVVKDTPVISITTTTFPSGLGDVLPIMTIRQNDWNVLTMYPLSFVEGTDKALSAMGTDLKSITTAVNAAPSAVNDVYFMLACRIGSPTVGASAYFFHLLESLYDADWDTEWWKGFGEDVWIGNHSAAYLANAWGQKHFDVKRGSELEFNVTYCTIIKGTTVGNIGPVGTYLKITQGRPLIGIANRLGPNAERSDIGKYHNFDFIFCYKQVSATEYVTYVMCGLVIENHIQHGQDHTRVLHTVSRNMPEGTGDVNGYFKKVNGAYGSFLLPMFKGILDKVNPFDLEQMLAESVILYVHTVSQSTVSWWQSPGFYAIVGEIVNIVVVIFSGSALSLSPDLTTLIRQIAIGLLTGIVSKYLFEALAPIIGEAAAAAIVGVTALVVLRYAPEGIKSLGELPWAEDLLKVARVIIDSVDIVNTKDALELTKDIAEFTKSADAFNEELARADKLLGTTDSNLKRSNINDIINAYETPEEFYTRTVHQGNIGVLGLDAIANYVANKLRLPKELPA